MPLPCPECAAPTRVLETREYTAFQTYRRLCCTGVAAHVLYTLESYVAKELIVKRGKSSVRSDVFAHLDANPDAVPKVAAGLIGISVNHFYELRNEWKRLRVQTETAKGTGGADPVR